MSRNTQAFHYCLTVESDPADLLADLAVLPHEEGVGGAAALKQTALVPGLK